MIGSVWQWLADASHWSGADGIWVRIWEHLVYSGVALLAAAAVAIPLGLAIGHTGRGRMLGVGSTGAMRAIPSLGLLFAAIMIFGEDLPGNAALFVPTIVVLAILAVPPILAGTYSGVEQVDPAARDAAAGMGMRGSQVLWRVEAPCALPLIASGLRSAALQVVATATLAATVSLGGLGRFLIDGIQQRDYAQMAGGAVVIAVVALLVDFVFAGVQRLVVSPGLSGRTTRKTGWRRTIGISRAGAPTTEKATT